MNAKSPHDQPGASEPELLSKIEDETTIHDNAAKGLQQKRWKIGFSLILLGPAAVLCSTAQFGLSPLNGHPRAGLALDCADAGLLLAALVASFWHFGGSQHEKWIHERLCTELLRRESFLLGAGVGPYLSPDVLSIRVENRLETIESPTRNLVELMPMATEPGNRTWRDELEDSRGREFQLLQDLPGAIEYYLKNRVEYQQGWFAGRSADHFGWASGFERSIQLILVAAVVLSVTHVGRATAKAEFPEEVGRWLFFVGIALTMLGVAAAGFQALLENERLGRSYAYHSERLETFAAHLRNLKSDLAIEKSTPQEVQFRFKRIVLDVEGMFSEELMQWRLVMEPRAPRADP